MSSGLQLSSTEIVLIRTCATGFYPGVRRAIRVLGHHGHREGIFLSTSSLGNFRMQRASNEMGIWYWFGFKQLEFCSRIYRVFGLDEPPRTIYFAINKLDVSKLL